MAERDLNLTSLVSGVVFVALGVVFLLDRLGIVTLAAELVLPVLLIGLGTAVLLGARRRSPEREERREPDAPEVEDRTDDADESSTR